MADLMKKAERLDEMRSKGVSGKLTLEEAQNIVYVWGAYLEQSGGIRFLLGSNIPESLLPYPIEILQGAINKMEAYYYEQGEHERVKLLEETEVLLIQYSQDDEAIKEVLAQFSNVKLREAMVLGLKDIQKNQAENGYLVDKKLWQLNKSRIEELLN